MLATHFNAIQADANMDIEANASSMPCFCDHVHRDRITSHLVEMYAQARGGRHMFLEPGAWHTCKDCRMVQLRAQVCVDGDTVRVVPPDSPCSSLIDVQRLFVCSKTLKPHACPVRVQAGRSCPCDLDENGCCKLTGLHVRLESVSHAPVMVEQPVASKRRRASAASMSLPRLVQAMLDSLVWGSCRSRVLALRLRQARQIARRTLPGRETHRALTWMSVVRAYRMATLAANDDAAALRMSPERRESMRRRVVKNACAVLSRLLPVSTLSTASVVLALLYTARTGLSNVIPPDAELYRYLPNAHALRQYHETIILQCYKNLTTARRVLVKKLTQLSSQDRSLLYASWE